MSDNLPVIRNAEVSKLAEQYPVMNPASMHEVQEILQANLGPGGLSEQDLERVKVPTGGGTTWTIEGIDGEEMVKEVSGPIAAWIDSRLYWQTPYELRGKQRTPPDCSSRNSLIGVGNPGGDCTRCPLAEFGSDPKGGRGQACKQVRRLMILRPDHIMPDIVGIPPTSHRNAVQYFRRLAALRIPYWAVITHLKLERTSNADGVDYARIVFTAGERFSPADREAFAPYHQQMVQVLRNIAVDPGDFDAAATDDATPPAGEYASPLDD